MSCTQDYRGNTHNTPNAFANYMKELATSHSSLRHTTQEPHYFRGELEEFYTGMRDRVNFPALIQEGSEIRFTSDNADNCFKERETSFIIIQNYDNDDDYDQIYDAFDICEKIGDEFIRKINADKYDTQNMVIKEFNIENVSCIQLQNTTQRYVGVRYSFTTSTPFWEEINPAIWQ